MNNVHRHRFKPDQHIVVNEDVTKPTEEEEVELNSKTQLLLSALQMEIEGYPLPGDNRFEPTKTKYQPVTDMSPMFSLDCEMCMTGDEFAVTRVSIVDEQESVLLDTFVKPEKKITNYLTRFSGVTPQIMAATSTTLKKVHKLMRKVLPDDAIICGQSLNIDLKYLQLIHPYVIDTSVIYNLSGTRSVKTGLKTLAARFLGQEIQASHKDGHCSIEDAVATLRLVQLKLSQSATFGDNVLSNRKFRARDINGLCQTLPLSQYMETKDVKVSVFYDYVNDDADKFVTLFSSTSSGGSGSGGATAVNTSVGRQVREAVARCLAHSDKAICLVLTNQGLCYVHF